MSIRSALDPLPEMRLTHELAEMVAHPAATGKLLVHEFCNLRARRPRKRARGMTQGAARPPAPAGAVVLLRCSGRRGPATAGREHALAVGRGHVGHSDIH